jgi:hypothetical protein
MRSEAHRIRKWLKEQPWYARMSTLERCKELSKRINEAMGKAK